MPIVQRLPRVPARFRSLYLGLLAVSALFGADLTVVSAVLPEMIRSFGWSYTEAATVLAAISIGYFASTFASGFVVPRLGPRATVVTGLVLMAGALAVFGATPLVLVNVLLHGLIGIGLGAIEVVINYGAMRIERDGRSQLMNLMHAAFSVGAVAGPLLAARLLDSGIPWQIAFRAVAVGAAGMAVWLVLLPFRRLEDGLGSGYRHAAAGAVALPLDRGLLVISVALLFLYVGAEVGVSSWLGEYFVSFFDTSPAHGALMVMLFWGGVLGGRLLLALGYTGTRDHGGGPAACRSGNGRPPRGGDRDRPHGGGSRLRRRRVRLLLDLSAGDVDGGTLLRAAPSEHGDRLRHHRRRRRLPPVSVRHGAGGAAGGDPPRLPAVRCVVRAAGGARHRGGPQDPPGRRKWAPLRQSVGLARQRKTRQDSVRQAGLGRKRRREAAVSGRQESVGLARQRE